MTDRSPLSDPDPEIAPVPSRRARSVLRWVLRGAVLLFFVVGIALLAVREFVLPRVNDYRAEISATLSRAAGIPVSIDAVEADWPGPHLRLQLSGVVLGGGDGRAPLRLDRVDASLGWSSLLRGEAYFHRIVLYGPALTVVREPDGSYHAAGIELGGQRETGEFPGWLFRQGEIAVLDAAVTWEDRLRGAPPLELRDADLRVDRSGGRFRFGLQARPSTAVAGRLEFRGDLVSSNPADPAGWHGQVFAAVSGAHLEGLTPWVDYPLPLSGEGDVQAWIEVAEGQPQSSVIDFVLADFGLRIRPSLPALDATSARGRLRAVKRADEFDLSLTAFELVTRSGRHLEPTDLELRLRGKEDPFAAGSLRATQFDLDVVAGLAAHLPLPEALAGQLDQLAPGGRLSDLQLAWDTHEGAMRLTRLSSRFSELAVRAGEGLPGVEGLSGEVEGDRDRGRFSIRSRNAVADMPRIFPRPRMSFEKLEAEGGWSRDAGGVAIHLEQARFENEDAAGEAQGTYRPGRGELGEIDFRARLTRAEGTAVWRYLPHTVNDDTREWLQRGLLEARVGDARLTLRGLLENFPYRDGDGLFRVTVEIEGGRLDYAPGWPLIEGIGATLRFEGPGMHLAAREASIHGVRLLDVSADVPDLDAEGGQIMTIMGTAQGATRDFLRFVSDSPVRERLDGFTDGMSAKGEGTLQLLLVMPLHRVSDTAVDGDFRFSDNHIQVADWLPPIEQAAGRLRFTGERFAIDSAEGRLLGAPMRLSADTVKDGVVRFDVSGGASIAALRRFRDMPLLEHLSGSTSWQATVDVRRTETTVALRSGLAGISSSLPDPFNKRSSERRPLALDLRFAPGARSVGGSLGAGLNFVFDGRERDGGFELLRGAVGLNAPARPGATGVALTARLDELDLDAWRRVLEAIPVAETSGGAGLSSVDLAITRLQAFGYDVADLVTTATQNEDGWRGELKSDVAGGRFAWQARGEGALQLRLDHLSLGKREVSDAEIARMLESDDAESLPDMDVVAERFELRGIDLGRLELRAANERGVWLLDALSIENADSRLAGSGRWRPGREPLTELSLRFQSDDIGRFLTRVGYPEVIRAGRAELDGDLSWRGIPTRVDYRSLSGAFRLEAANGRFSKLEPGVGRLLGVLSLQSLPRRLKLDFSDVFSEGFAFDRVAGNVTVTKGVVRSDDFEIGGPAARIWIAGSADLLEETQDIKVVVQPTLSESVAVGAAAGLINPVAGVIAYLAQKILSDPIERMFAYGYGITGTWADPQVEKLPVGQGKVEQTEGPK